MANTDADYPEGVELTDTGVGALLKAFMRHRAREGDEDVVHRLEQRMSDDHLAETDVDIGREARAACYLRFESAEEWRVFREAVEGAAGGMITESTADQILDFARGVEDGAAWTL